MQRKVGRDKIAELLLCVVANIMSIVGYVIWCKQTKLSYELIMDRAYDLGWFGSLYFVSLLCLLIQIFNPKWLQKSVVLKAVMKYPFVLLYLIGIFCKLLQGMHFILPAAQDILFDGDKFTIGFLVDMYFLVLCFFEVFFKEKVLYLWSIGMATIYLGLLGFYFINGRISLNVIFEISSHIIWHIMFAIAALNSFEMITTEGEKDQAE